MPISLISTRKRQMIVNWDERSNITTVTLLVDVLDSLGAVQKQEMLQLDGVDFSTMGSSSQRQGVSALASLMDTRVRTERGI